MKGNETMRSDNEKLTQYLKSFLATVNDTQSGDTENESDNDDAPHLEKIDFDELSAVLQDTLTELEAFRTRTREYDVVRRWFLDRISSLDRGRQAILGASPNANIMPSSENLSLPELIRLFEEASARLRSTAISHDTRRGSNAGKKANSLEPFKS